MPEYQLVRRRIDNYLRWRFHFVEGCMRRIDALIFRELISAQVQRQVSGSLVEIGVHFGRSFFVLASGRSASEKSLAIDLFENDALYTGRPGLGRSVGFFRNCRKLGFQLSEAEVLKGSSLQVTPNEIRCRVGPVRFFSIDGGHMYEHVANDLFLAQKLMVPGGIISVDDFSTPLWPEVPIATFDWLRLAPLSLSWPLRTSSISARRNTFPYTPISSPGIPACTPAWFEKSLCLAIRFSSWIPQSSPGPPSCW